MKRITKRNLLFKTLVGKLRMPKTGFYSYFQYIWHVVDCIVDDVTEDEHYEISKFDTIDGRPFDLLI